MQTWAVLVPMVTLAERKQEAYFQFPKYTISLRERGGRGERRTQERRG